jgi:cell division protein FtsB
VPQGVALKKTGWFTVNNIVKKVLNLFLASLAAAVTVYCSLSMGYGAASLSVYQELTAGKDIQLENIQKLKSINSELKHSWDNLQHDRDTLAIHARQLGYGYEGDQVIRVVEHGGVSYPKISVGDIVSVSEPVFLPDWVIKICALFTFILVFAALLTFTWLRR